MHAGLARGWEIASSAWKVLQRDKRLALFPVLSGMGCVLLLSSFVLPIALSPELMKRAQVDAIRNQELVALAALAFYVVNSFIVVFFNSALVTCALIRYAGGEPTMRDGITAAWSRLPQIIAWSLVAGTVGWVIRMIERRVQFLGKFVVAMLGVAWTAATFFVVPVVVVEKAQPLEALRRSAAIFRQTWGESLGVRTGLEAFGFVMMLPGFFLFYLATMLAGPKVDEWFVLLVGAGFVWMLAAAVIASAFNGIFVAALYIYASRGVVPQEFDAATLERAFPCKAKSAAIS